MKPSKNIKYQEPRLDKTRVAKYKKGEEPNDVLYWLSRPAIERILTLERIRKEYNLWKYGAESGFQRVYRVVKRQRG
ncbi:MAG: toxin secretion, membrane fusion protein [Bacteroidia bacterium]